MTGTADKSGRGRASSPDVAGAVAPAVGEEVVAVAAVDGVPRDGAVDTVVAPRADERVAAAPPDEPVVAVAAHDGRAHADGRQPADRAGRDTLRVAAQPDRVVARARENDDPPDAAGVEAPHLAVELHLVEFGALSRLATNAGHPVHAQGAQATPHVGGILADHKIPVPTAHAHENHIVPVGAGHR